jgi:Raf kinase inhibitor-like YbhB/YbcL family protein
MPWHDLPVPRSLVTVAAGLVLLAACNDDGRTLAPAPPVPAQQATTTSAPVGSVPAEQLGLVLTSPAFTDGGILDPAFTCDGIDVPPPLEVSGVPATAAELAIVVTDRDADGFVHWVIAGLSPSVTRIESGVLPPAAVTARSDGGVQGWQGPCPPDGDAPHAYELVVYAAAEPIGLDAGLDGRQAISIIEGAAIASDVLTVFYGDDEE